MSPPFSSRSDTLGQRLRAVALPLLAWWVLLLATFGAFSLSILVTDSDPESILVLGFFAAITALGSLTGQAAALLRLRDWLLFSLLALFWTLGFAFSAFTAMATGTMGALVGVFVLLFPLFVIGGAWSLRAGRALVGTWVPLLYATACAIIVAEEKGKVGAWRAGAKWAVWDAYTLMVLGLTIVLVLVYLIARENHRLALWRRGPRGPLAGSVREAGASQPRLSCVGWLLLAGLALFLSVGSAVMAPYLWRTGPGDRGGGDPEQTDDLPPPEDNPSEEQAPAREPSKMQRRWEKVRGDAQAERDELMRPAPNQGLDPLATLLTSLLLALLLLFSFYRPVRRILLARHFERPLLRRTPTERVRNGWRLVEVALGDAGVEPQPGEPAAVLLRRATPQLRALSPSGVEVHGLAEAAEIRDRVEYGLVVHPEDVETMERVARWTYHTVWDRLGEWRRLKMVYRRI